MKVGRNCNNQYFNTEIQSNRGSQRFYSGFNFSVLLCYSVSLCWKQEENEILLPWVRSSTEYCTKKWPPRRMAIVLCFYKLVMDVSQLRVSLPSSCLQR